MIVAVRTEPRLFLVLEGNADWLIRIFVSCRSFSPVHDLSISHLRHIVKRLLYFFVAYRFLFRYNELQNLREGKGWLVQDFLRNLEQILLERDQKRPWLSHSTGIPLSTINNWFSNNRIPRADQACLVARALGTSVETLVLGDTMQYFDSNGRPYKALPHDQVVMLPFIPQKVSAGPGQELLPPDGDVQRHLPVLASLISRYPRQQLRVVEVRGDSMTGIHLNDGDMVIFVQGLVRADGVYVITLQGDVLVKRIQFDSVARQVSIMSENPRYPTPQTVPSDSDILRIEGKVVAWFHLHPY